MPQPRRRPAPGQRRIGLRSVEHAEHAKRSDRVPHAKGPLERVQARAKAFPIECAGHDLERAQAAFGGRRTEVLVEFEQALQFAGGERLAHEPIEDRTLGREPVRAVFAQLMGQIPTDRRAHV